MKNKILLVFGVWIFIFGTLMMIRSCCENVIKVDSIRAKQIIKDTGNLEKIENSYVILKSYDGTVMLNFGNSVYEPLYNEDYTQFKYNKYMNQMHSSEYKFIYEYVLEYDRETNYVYMVTENEGTYLLINENDEPLMYYNESYDDYTDQLQITYL